MGTRGIDRRGEREPQRALLHPAFGLALVVLVVNDHLLKGAGVVPAAITGKLSDVAGLVVAPVALAALVRARSARAQLAVHVLVALVFAMTELSQSTADLIAHALRAIGVSVATLVADPTDLWALAVLPLPYALLRAPSAPVSRAAPRVSLAVALLACVASPSPPTIPPHWTTIAYVVNGTSAPVDVRLAWSAAEVDCATLASLPVGITLGRAVDPAIFDDGVTFHLEPGATVPIDEVAARAAVGPMRTAFSDGGVFRGDAARPAVVRTCQLVLLRSDGATDRVVLVSNVPTFSVETHVGDPPMPQRAVQLLGDADAHTWTVGTGLPSADAEIEDAPTSCRTDRPSVASSSAFGRTGTIASLALGVDGCIDVTLTQTDGSTAHVFVCGLPLSMVPFAVGDVVDVTTSDALHLAMRSTTGDTLTLAGPLDAPLTLPPNTVTGGAPEACNGERIACGAFVVPTAFTLAPIAAGDDPTGVVTRTDASGRTQVLVGASERVLVAMPGCSGGRDHPGAHAQLAVAHSLL